MKSRWALIESIMAVGWMAIFISLPALADEHEAARQQIRRVISHTYDKPEHRVMTDPVVVADGYALADWIQGDRGGRALMQEIDGLWTIVACGADGFKQLSVLEESGIDRKVAESLLQQLDTAEQGLPAEKLHLFSLFGTAGDPVHAEHHHQ